MERTAVVVRYKDKRILKGYVDDFDPTNPLMLVFPADKLRTQALQVTLSDLKAIFFVRDLSGNPQYQERKDPTGKKKPLGRMLKVTFQDGETLVGSTLEYDANTIGFSLFPIDLQSNNVRVFVINSAVRRVSEIPFQKAAGPLQIMLTKQRRILQVNKKYNPVLSPWWFSLIAILFAPFLLVAFNDLPVSRTVDARPPLAIAPPKFGNGATIQVKASDVVYALGDEPPPALGHDELVRGIILDVGWSQGRWLYRLQLSPTQLGWAFEENLTAAP